MAIQGEGGEKYVAHQASQPKSKRKAFFRYGSIVLVILVIAAYLMGQRRHLPSALDGKYPVGNGTSLRVLPLGDSITEGYGSSDHNGYRLVLLDMLKASGSKDVHFIGSQENGFNNAENRHEGHGGYVIHEITDFLKEHPEVLRQKPNIVLLHAGTNDVIRDPPELPYDQAPQRLGVLINLVLEACPDTVLLVAQIINATNAQPRVDAFNAKIPALIEKQSILKHKVRIVDHANVGGKDLEDGVHPNDSGYKLMANNWFKALKDLPQSWIQKPQ